MYKVITTDNPYGSFQTFVIRNNGNDCFTSFLADPSNTDYANFKAQINADEAQLQDADGVIMTAEQAKEYIKELP